MARRPVRRGQVGVVLGMALVVGSCRQPTQITLELTTDVPCDVLREKGVTISAGALGAVESKPPSEVKYACEGGKIGTMVVVPSGEKNAEVEVRVVAGVTSRAETCEAGNRYAGCIVARRAVRYVEHEGLKLRMELRQECINVPCDEGERRTCVKGGACASAVVETSEVCAGEGCGEEGLAKGGAGGREGFGGQGEAGNEGGQSGATTVTPRQSCEGLPQTCGTSGNDDCCATDEVMGGKFPMGRSDIGTDSYAGGNSEQPEHDVIVNTFELDRYEVTVGRFRTFVVEYDAFRATLKEGMGAHPLVPSSGWRETWADSLSTRNQLVNNLKCDSTFQTWTDSAGTSATENRPINCVSWYEAFAFCLWDGGRMPTEAEWEYAAAGGIENRLYPWGSQAPDNSLASYGCLSNGSFSCEAGDLPVVGSTPAGKGRYGQLDLAGSLWEWTLDWYNASWYGQHSASGSCDNCASIGLNSSRMLRGGVFSDISKFLRAASRNSDVPSKRDSYYGFRCARTPAGAQ